jgi:hypothetical protein
MTAASTAFTSQANGFHFTNSFDFSFDLDLPLVGSIDLGDVAYGLCGGMCFAALDFYYAGKPIPSQVTVPDVGSSLHLYLVDRQVESLSLPAGLMKVLEWMILNDTEVGRRTASQEFPKLRKRIDRGDPAVLALIRTSGISDPGHNHQVVARAYKYGDTDKKVEIVLYDPNHPEQEPRLTMDFSDPRSGISPAQSSGEPLRGFFLMDYKRQAPLV